MNVPPALSDAARLVAAQTPLYLENFGGTTDMTDPAAFVWVTVPVPRVHGPMTVEALLAAAEQREPEVELYRQRYWAALGDREPEHEFADLPLPALPCAIAAIDDDGSLNTVMLFGNHKGQVKTRRIVCSGEHAGAVADAVWSGDHIHQTDPCAVLLLTQLATLAAPPAARACRPNPKNAAREKRGKRPLYEFSVVELARPRVRSGPGGGTHASPRLHNRRGHFRKKPSGGEVWVRPCKVGSASSGVVIQSYTIKGTAV